MFLVFVVIRSDGIKLAEPHFELVSFIECLAVFGYESLEGGSAYSI